MKFSSLQRPVDFNLKDGVCKLLEAQRGLSASVRASLCHVSQQIYSVRSWLFLHAYIKHWRNVKSWALCCKKVDCCVQAGNKLLLQMEKNSFQSQRIQCKLMLVIGIASTKIGSDFIELLPKNTEGFAVVRIKSSKLVSLRRKGSLFQNVK